MLYQNIDQINVIIDKIFFEENSEKEYKDKLMEEIILYKNHTNNEIFAMEAQKIEKIRDRKLDVMQMNWLAQEISKRRMIYDKLPENLIEDYINKSYIENKKYYEERQKQEKISQYKGAWQEKNTLWKLFNKKYNPKKFNFDNMSDKDVESLSNNIKNR